MTEKDTLFTEIQDEPVGSFEFNERVVRVFPDMIERSVPGYRLLLELTPLIVQRAVQPNSIIYDLGCSLGAATLAARRAVRKPNVSIVGVDQSSAMIAKCQQVIDLDNSEVPVRLTEADITACQYPNASLILLYFTLQFVPPPKRSALLQTIYEGLNPGGVLVLAEKLAFDEVDDQTWMDAHHLDFKRAQGYSDLEIAQKRQAIEHVLIPQTESGHHEALQHAGFSHIQRWFQCFNFTAFVAIK